MFVGLSNILKVSKSWMLGVQVQQISFDLEGTKNKDIFINLLHLLSSLDISILVLYVLH